MASKLSILNKALSHLAIGSRVSDLDNDDTEAAGAFRTHYETAKFNVLREIRYPFTETSVGSELITSQSSIYETYPYVYKFPNSALKVYTAKGFFDQVPFKIGRTLQNGPVIFASQSINSFFVAYDVPEAEFDPAVENYIALESALLMAPEIAESVEKGILDRLSGMIVKQRNSLLRNSLTDLMPQDIINNESARLSSFSTT